MKNMKLYAVAGVVALAAVGGTFAYYNASQTFNNPFDTAKYGTFAMEEFNPADGHKWEPGAKVDKKVFATNTGDSDVWVRVSLNEIWNFQKDHTDADELKFDITEVYDQNPSDGKARQEFADDGKVLADKSRGSVVYKEFVNTIITDVTKKTENTKWYYKDGYFYYMQPLAPGKVTPDLMNSVTLCSDTDMGKFVEKNYYLIANEGMKPRKDDGSVNEELVAIKADGTKKDNWVEYTGEMTAATNDNGDKVVILNGEELSVPAGKTIYTYKNKELGTGEHGYANANYKLNIQVDFVQTDKEAAAEAGWDADALQDLGFFGTAAPEAE